MTTMTAHTFGVLGGLPPSRRSSGTLPALFQREVDAPQTNAGSFGTSPMLRGAKTGTVARASPLWGGAW
ncbi:hypothetical protein HRTV-2_gp107 [Halorubrum virus HRTV-2]|nr:hypothetical protein HRTV-2_gp107 [Halorubrum virus HRTV-2]